MAREPFAARLTSIWIGGVFYWVIKGFKGKLTDQLNDQYDNRNFWTGYVISMIGLGFILYVIFFRY